MQSLLAMNWSHSHHLAYCTNIHPAESWEETFEVLKKDVLAVRDRLVADGVCQGPFARSALIGTGCRGASGG